MHAMAEVNRQTARGAAIAGTAFLDLLLRAVLEKQMRPRTQIQNTLFENRGALQDFSARIQIAYAFKMIGYGAYSDLFILRDIRNAFAHSADPFDFDREDIASMCKALWYPRHITYENRTVPVTPRELFVRGVELLADGLSEPVRNRPGYIPLPPTFIQAGPVGPPQPRPPRKTLKTRKTRSPLEGPLAKF